MRRHALHIAVLLALAVPARAQEAPRPETLVRAWAASQGAHADEIEGVTLREHSEWTIDGPFRLRRTRLVADVHGERDGEGWARDPVEVAIDGRPVPLERWQQWERQRRQLLGPRTEEAARTVILLHDMLEHLVPAGGAVPDALDGVPAWRVELVARTAREPLDRYTLWFDRQRGHLLRSRAVARPRRSERPLVVVTEYARVEGLDVPRRRRLEGSTQMKRRLRTYTVLYSYQARYDDYRFFRR